MDAAEASASAASASAPAPASAPHAAAQPSPSHVHNMTLDQPVAANGEAPEHTAIPPQQPPQLPAKATPSLGKRRGRASESEMAAANKDLIVSGKRSRRKVDKSADFLIATPKAAKNDETKRKRSFSKPAVAAAAEADAAPVEDGEPMRPTASEQENAAKRERLSKRKTELEAYLRRLQVALAAERRRVGAGVADAESIAATALPGGDRRGPVQRRRSTAVAKSRKATPKTPAAAAARPLKEAEAPSVEAPEAETGMSASTVKLCLRVVDDLLHNQHGDIFATAVDWKALNIPTYPQIVKNPMDLGTVRSRLTSGFYSGLDAFASDIQLTWDNAKLFNAPKSFVHEATLEMDRIWQRKYANLMREKRRASKALQAAASAFSAEPSVVTPPPPKPSSKPKAKPKTKATAPPTKTSKAAAAQIDQLQPMTIEEKSKLRADLMNLPTHHIGPVLAIMRESTAASATESQEEIEIDVSALDTSTARKLQHYMKSVQTSRPNSRPASAPRKSRANGAVVPPAQPGSDSESDLYSDSDTSSSSGFADLSSDEDAPQVTSAAATAAGSVADLSSAHVPAAAAAAAPPSSADVKAAAAASSASHANSSAPEQIEKMDIRPEDQAEDVFIENTDAWSSLTKSSEQESSSAPEKTEGAALWSDYKNKDALNRQRERELVEQEDRRRAELQRMEAERAEREKRLLAQREADEARRRQEAEERERARLIQLEEEREAARRAREQDEEVDDQAGAVEEFHNLMSA